MTQRISMKTIFIAVGVLALAVLTTFGGARVYRNWADVQYFGKIIEIKNGNFLIKADEGGEKVILMDQYTAIRRGRRPVKEGLQVGSYIIVVGDPNPEGFIKAKVIRILDAPPL